MNNLQIFIKEIYRKMFFFGNWHFVILYLPFTFLWLYYSLKLKDFIYFTRLNPSIKWGGAFGYSKYDVLKNLDTNVFPKTHIFFRKEDIQTPEFPFIAKPDIGERGRKVSLVSNQAEWSQYLKNADFPLLIQSYIHFEKEYSIFYMNHKHLSNPYIFSITGKQFLEIIGDGSSTIKKLILQKKFNYSIQKKLLRKWKKHLENTLKKDEKLILEPIGNHHLGTEFYDASYLYSHKLRVETLKKLKPLQDFEYGRIDVKAKSNKEFKNGNYIILEINGVNSEAIHIYDPKYSLIDAYIWVYKKLQLQYQLVKNKKNYIQRESVFVFTKELLKHWKL